MKKRVLAGLLAGVMAFSCVTGCGTRKQSGGNGNQTVIEIKYQKAGLGEEWLKNVIAGFEKAHSEYKVEYSASASASAVQSAFGDAEIDTTDLYLATKVYDTTYLEPLNDVLETTVDGEGMPIKDKFADYYLNLEKSTDGSYYNLTYGGGLVGIVYNREMFKEAGIEQLPRTTEELALVCDTLYSNDMKAFCHFSPTGYWEAYMTDVFFLQYEGRDYVMNQFYGCTDDEGNSPSLNIFTKEDGRYEALKVYEQLITPEYTLQGSNTYDHTTIQTMWLNGECAMMVTGTWVESEMSSTASTENFVMMKMPVISSIINKLTTVTTEAQLRKVITAIDEVTDGVKKASAYQQGENYVVEGIQVSEKDWNYIKAARNTLGNNYSGESAYIPNYSDAKEGAKEFLKYLYSDEGYKIYTDTLGSFMPLSFSEGEIDTSKWSDFMKSQWELNRTSEQFATEFIAGKHQIFVAGGASKFGSMDTYVDKFCASNPKDRITAAEAWETIQKKTKDNYNNTWIKNIQ